MQREQTDTEQINGIEIRHYSDGSVEAQYQGKTSSCDGGFVHCAVGRVLYWNETGRTMESDRCLNESKGHESGKKYEYRIDEYGEEYPLEELLNDVGSEGWRLAAVTDPCLAVLERETDG